MFKDPILVAEALTRNPEEYREDSGKVCVLCSARSVDYKRSWARQACMYRLYRSQWAVAIPCVIPDNPVSNELNEHDEKVLENIGIDCISKAEIRAAIRKMQM